jgi:hypothetical protein
MRAWAILPEKRQPPVKRMNFVLDVQEDHPATGPGGIGGYQRPAEVAHVYAWTGERDHAFEWLAATMPAGRCSWKA